MILSEAGKPNGKIGMFLQPDYPFPFRLLASLNPTGNLVIEHILSLNNNPQKQLCNLQYLKEIFPIYTNGLDYETWYFYNNTQHNFYCP